MIKIKSLIRTIPRFPKGNPLDITPVLKDLSRLKCYRCFQSNIPAGIDKIVAI